MQRLFLDDLSGAHGAIVLRAPKASAFGQGVPASKKGRLQAFAVSYAELPPQDQAAGKALPRPASPRMCSSATIRSSPRTRPRPRSATCWRSSRSSTRCCWNWTIRWTALRAVVEPLLESGKARVQGAETLVVSDPA